MIKHSPSLVPMNQEHRKPIVDLMPADGAIGAHAKAGRDAGRDFKKLTKLIREQMEKQQGENWDF